MQRAAGPSIGSLVLLIYAFPDGPRGQLFPARERKGDLVVGGGGVATIGAVWPDDECPTDAYPVAIDAPHAWLDGKSPLEVHEEWRDKVMASEPAVGRWLDGTEVRVQVAVGSPQSVCLGEGARMSIRSDSRLITSDGRVNAPFPLAWPSPESYELSFREQWRVFPAEEFGKATGITGVDAAGSPLLSAMFDARYSRSGAGVAAEGVLDVWGSDGAVECLRWPPSEFPEYCGRHLR
jgi:hypothetical protein